MRFNRIMAGFAAMAAVAVACYHGRGGSSYSPTAPTVLEVQNQSFDDMNIYVLPEGGTQIRLGTATGKSTAHFTIPEYVMHGTFQSLRFVARPIATQRGPVSDQISATPGDTVVLISPPA